MANIVKELRKKSTEELLSLVSKAKQQLLQIRFDIANGDAEKLQNIKEIKKTVARILTILNERSIEAQKVHDKNTSVKGSEK